MRGQFPAPVLVAAFYFASKQNQALSAYHLVDHSVPRCQYRLCLACVRSMLLLCSMNSCGALQHACITPAKEAPPLAVLRAAALAGEYRNIMNLCRVLPNGSAAKRAVDAAIDLASPVGAHAWPSICQMMLSVLNG